MNSEGERSLARLQLSSGDLEEGFDPLKVALGNLAGGFAGRVVGEARLGIRLLLFE